MPRWLPVFAVLLPACTEPAPPDKALRFDPAAPDPEQIESLATDHLGSTSLLDDIGAVAPRRTTVDPRGTAHVRLDQFHGGVPVLGGQAIVHLPADGAPVEVTDHLVHEVDVDVFPSLAESRAVELAREATPTAQLAGAKLVVVRDGGVDHLAWRVALRFADSPSLPVVFVDAHSGETVFAYDNLKTGRDRRTFDAQSTQTWPATPARAEGDPAVGSIPVDVAHDYTGVAWDYYDVFHGRDSYDDAGAPVLSVVELGPNYNNAYWNGTILGYGDGGSNASFAESLDIVAHELTHAVTDHTADLIYNQQSGGLNEATSDIMAAVVESWDDGWTVNDATTWRVGEGRGGLGFRNMRNPNVGSFLNYNDGLDVHVSSGIANRAFVAWVDSPSLTIEEAGNIWYTALSNYMTPRTTFAEARTATQQAAFDLFGPGDQVGAVAAGWTLVDVPGTPAFEVFDQVGPIALGFNESQTYSFVADPAALGVRFVLVGDDGDADLYVSASTTAPTPTTHDCASERMWSSREICTFDPSPGVDYTVLVEAAWAFTDARLYAWQAVPGGVVCTDNDADGFTTCEGDCNDSSNAVFPGAVETCNGIDDNCNGDADGDAIDPLTWYRDDDGDGFGDPNADTLACDAPTGFVDNPDDCDDDSEYIFPGGVEVCNLADDDCDGTIDGPDAFGAVPWYDDDDQDGFGDPNEATMSCSVVFGAVRNGDDCDDTDEFVHPDAVEICNTIDDNCDGTIDPPDAAGAAIWFLDADGDGFGNPASSMVQCDAPPGHVFDAGDCDDGASAVHPDADEVCNGIDDNCDTVVDPASSVGAPLWYRDDDGDGYGRIGSSAVPSCTPVAGRAETATDCDDTRNDISPGAPEVCDINDVDEDCDGSINEAGADGAATYWLDLDGDGFGDPATESAECTWPAGAIPAGGLADCDDASDGIFPGAEERCDGVDEDCNGEIDDDASDAGLFYVDEDGDGFGSEPVTACEPPPGTSDEPGDCDDSDAGAYPGAEEIPDDDVDQDCDGRDVITPEPPPTTTKPTNDTPLGCSTTGSSGLAGVFGLGLLALVGRRRR